MSSTCSSSVSLETDSPQTPDLEMSQSVGFSVPRDAPGDQCGELHDKLRFRFVIFTVLGYMAEMRRKMCPRWPKMQVGT